jgi:hypothetical protein
MRLSAFLVGAAFHGSMEKIPVQIPLGRTVTDTDGVLSGVGVNAVEVFYTFTNRHNGFVSQSADYIEIDRLGMMIARTNCLPSKQKAVMKITQLIALTLLLLTGPAKVVAASSSLTLQYGPSFPQPMLPITRTQTAYDFDVSQLWHPDANNTLLSISVTEHVEESTGFTSGPDFICACVSLYTPPRQSVFTFSLPSPVPVPFGYQIYNNSYNPIPFGFDAMLDNALFMGGISTVHIGEMEIQTINGIEILTRFAADFKMQFGEMSFVEAIDPATGLISFTEEYTAYPGNWFAGSLRYQSDTEAFAYLAPVPEASTYGMLLAGLGLVGVVAWRRKPAEG